MEKEQILNWKDIHETIGKIGSENGKIIYDAENINGARITIEKETVIAPFSVTIGIYGILFHTHFTSTESEAKDFVTESIKKIESLLIHIEVDENQQDENWKKGYNDLLEKITE